MHTYTHTHTYTHIHTHSQTHTCTQAEADESGRARSAAEEALRKHRVESREVESEHSRLEAEGPASHRKKDMLDKATKEVCA